MLGELFPGRKLSGDEPDADGVGRGHDPGQLDLDAGVIYLAKRTPPGKEADDAPADAED